MRLSSAFACVLACGFAAACSDEEEPNAGTTLFEAGASGGPNGVADAAQGAPLRDGGTPANADSGGPTPPANRDASSNVAVTDAGRSDAASAAQDAATSAVVSDASSSTKPDAASGTSDSGSAGAPEAGSGNPAYPPLTNGCPGFATRYWDCCKPHCGWSSNTSGSTPLTTCNQSDGPYSGNYNVQSACGGGSAFMCQGNAPWSVSSRLAYGYAAVSSRGDICGKCYQLQFTGTSRNAGNDPGSAALGGKTMIVQATNVGGDFGSGQFDLLIPGGGVGKFNACSTQWSVGSGELGAQYGGFLATCKQQVGAGNHAGLKSCVMQRCSSVFGARGLSKLEAGCRWFVEWFEVADNPALQYKEVACPQELKSRGINRNTGASSSCSL